jgi:hypothetical protein
MTLRLSLLLLLLYNHLVLLVLLALLALFVLFVLLLACCDVSFLVLGKDKRQRHAKRGVHRKASVPASADLSRSTATTTGKSV